jgi:hypothetical protein
VSKLRREKRPIRSQAASPEATTSRIASHTATRLGSASARVVRLYKGGGLSQVALSGLIERAPLVVPINALGYNHSVFFCGVI